MNHDISNYLEIACQFNGSGNSKYNLGCYEEAIKCSNESHISLGVEVDKVKRKSFRSK